MLDLIPSLLSQLTTQRAALDDVQPTGTELVFQREAVVPTAIAPIAPPESLPSERLPPVPAATPIVPTQTAHVASSPLQSPKAENALGAAIAHPLSTQVAPTIGNPSVQNQAAATQTPNSAIEQPSPSQTSNSNQSKQLLERRQVLKQRLAEIVAKDAAKKVAQESVVSRTYESVSQGKFDQARQLLQDPTLSVTVRADLVNTINSLETKSRKVGVAQATEPIKMVLNQRQSQRQQDLLKSLPSLPPLPTPVHQASINQGFRSVPIAIQTLPQPLINRQIAIASSASSDSSGLRTASPDYSTTSGLQAYRGLSIPNNLKGEQIMYPLPLPAPITSKFGWRVHPVSGDRRFHAGVDLGAAQGTPILATREGRVAVADRMGGYGLAVVLQHAQGKQDTLYAHMSEMFVHPGDQVKPGTIIGRVGTTGLSTGPHLHYETRKQQGSSWVTTDPGPQLEAARTQLVQMQKIGAGKVEQQKG